MTTQEIEQESGPRPTVGGIVHYTPGPGDEELAGHDATGAVFAALVAYGDNHLVNLAVFDREGTRRGRGAVPAAPPGAAAGTPEAAGCWSWPATA